MLKTLKDLEKEYNLKYLQETYDLKEAIEINHELNLHFIPQLKVEAIKWVKQKFELNPAYDSTDLFEERVKERARDEFMEFLNITEDDLK